MRERAGDIAPLLTQEQGKPLVEAKGEALAAADIIEWFADEGLRVYGRIVPSRGNLAVRQMVLKDPVGPVAAFTPWNFPINQVVRKMGAALAAGCSMLVKAPEETPGRPRRADPAFADAGLPPGVLGLVYGDPAEISSYLIPHPVIRKITFTGSTPVGKQLAALAGQHMKRVTMELGGHAPVIVCEDADIGAGRQGRRRAPSSATPARSASRPPASWCTRASRTSSPQALAKYAQGLKVGDGLAEGTQMGPLANPRRLTAMAEFTEDAVQARRQGARRRRAHRRRRQLLAADHPDRRAAGSQGVQRRALRPDGRASAASTRWKRRSPKPTACPSAWPATPSPGR